MRGAPITGRLAAAALLAIAIALPLLVPAYYVQFATKVLIMGLLAMALNLVVGFGGLVSLCHAAFFGLAGYVLALAALAIGALSLRTRGVYFIMVTLAFGEMLFFLFHDTKIAGGSDGTFVYYKPEAMIGGFRLLDLEKAATFYWVVLAIMVASIALLHAIVRSPFGPASPAISRRPSSATSPRRCSAGTSPRRCW